MTPEENVIDPSSLTKFRRLRLQDMNLLDMLINKTVEIALEKGLINSKLIIVDSTHTKSRYNQKSPKEYLQEKSKNVRKAVYQFDENMVGKFPTKPQVLHCKKGVCPRLFWNNIICSYSLFLLTQQPL